GGQPLGRRLLSPQRVDDLAERGAYGALILSQGLLAACLGGANVRLRPPEIEQGCGGAAGDLPSAGAAAEQPVQFEAFQAEQRAQRQAREIGCARNADLRIGGRELSFRAADVWPPLQQGGGKVRRQDGRHRQV